MLSYHNLQISFLCLLLASFLNFSNDNLEEQFLNQAPQSWKLLQQRYADFFQLDRSFGFETEYHLSRGLPIELKTEGREKIVYKQMGKDYAVLELISEAKGVYFQDLYERYDHGVYGLNPKYQFQIERKSLGSPLLLQELIERQKTAEEDRLQRLVEYYPGGDNFKGYLKFFGENPIIFSPIKAWSDLDNFKIFRIDQIKHKGIDAVELECEYELEKELYLDGRSTRIREKHQATAIFDPNAYWTLLQVKGGDDKTYKEITYEYEKIDGIPFVKLKHILNYDRTNDEKMSEQITTNRFNLKRPSARDFSVVAYGFPEPSGFRTQRPQWQTYLMWGLGVCLLVGLVLVFGKRITGAFN